MVNDGHLNSQPDPVNITVVAPLECKLKIAPSTINLRSNRRHILAHISLPDGFTAGQTVSDEPLVIYPGNIKAMKQWLSDDPDQAGVFAFFDTEAFAGQMHSGPAEVTVAGKLLSGQLFFGRDTVQIIETGKAPRRRTNNNE
jgi:hypothetical protein